jgi:hypothetical protein
MRWIPACCCLATLAVAARPSLAQPYSIRLRTAPDTGMSAVVRLVQKDTGSIRRLDAAGKPLSATTPQARDLLYTITVLEKDLGRVTRSKRLYDKALGGPADKVAALIQQGRGVVIEVQDGKRRVGVVGAPVLDAAELERLAAEVDEPLDFADLVAPSRRVDVGESWEFDFRPLLATFRGSGFDFQHSIATARLLKVYFKQKSLFGVIEFQVKIAINYLDGTTSVDPPALIEAAGTIDAAIDGSSCAATESSTFKFQAASRLLAPGFSALLHSDLVTVSRLERSAEQDDPKLREVPTIDFTGSAAWKVFSSKSGRFRASFPGTPQEQSGKDSTGNPVIGTGLELKNGEIAYYVNVVDFSGSKAQLDPKRILEAIVKNADVASKSEIQLNGVPGLELVREGQQNGVKITTTQRVVMAHGRLYQVVAFATAAHAESLDARKFLDSFSILEPEPMPPAKPK